MASETREERKKRLNRKVTVGGEQVYKDRTGEITKRETVPSRTLGSGKVAEVKARNIKATEEEKKKKVVPAEGSPEAEAQRRIDIERAGTKILADEAAEKQATAEQAKESFGKISEPIDEGDGEKTEQSGVSKFFFGHKDINVQAGTLPLSPAGGLGSALGKIDEAAALAAKGAKATKNIFKGEEVIENLLKDNPLKGLEPAKKAIRREWLAQRIARMGGLRHDDAIRAINSYNKWSQPQLMKFMTSKPAIIAAGTGIATIGGIIGADTIWSWYALDNVATRSTFVSRNVEDALTSGAIKEDGTPFTIDDAQEMFKETDMVYDLALKKVNATARYNPYSFGARKLLMAGIEADHNAYLLQKQTFYTKYGLL